MLRIIDPEVGQQVVSEIALPQEGDLFVEALAPDAPILERIGSVSEVTRFQIGQTYRTEEVPVKAKYSPQPSRRTVHNGQIRNLAQHERPDFQKQPQKEIRKVPILTVEEIFAEPHMTKIEEKDLAANSPSETRIVFHMDASYQNIMDAKYAGFCAMAALNNCVLRRDRNTLILTPKDGGNVRPVLSEISEWGTRPLTSTGKPLIEKTEFWVIKKDTKNEKDTSTDMAKDGSVEPPAPDEKPSIDPAVFEKIAARIPGIEQCTEDDPERRFLVIDHSSSPTKTGKLMAQLNKKGFKTYVIPEAKVIVVEALGEEALKQIWEDYMTKEITSFYWPYSSKQNVFDQLEKDHSLRHVWGKISEEAAERAAAERAATEKAVAAPEPTNQPTLPSDHEYPNKDSVDVVNPIDASVKEMTDLVAKTKKLEEEIRAMEEEFSKLNEKAKELVKQGKVSKEKGDTDARIRNIFEDLGSKRAIVRINTSRIYELEELIQKRLVIAATKNPGTRASCSYTSFSGRIRLTTSAVEITNTEISSIYLHTDKTEKPSIVLKYEDEKSAKRALEEAYKVFGRPPGIIAQEEYFVIIDGGSGAAVEVDWLIAKGRNLGINPELFAVTVEKDGDKLKW